MNKEDQDLINYADELIDDGIESIFDLEQRHRDELFRLLLRVDMENCEWDSLFVATKDKNVQSNYLADKGPHIMDLLEERMSIRRSEELQNNRRMWLDRDDTRDMYY